MGAFTDQITADARDVLCNPAEFGVQVKHTVRNGPVTYRKALFQPDEPVIDQDNATGHRTIYPATFFLTVAAGQGIADPQHGDTLETQPTDGKVYTILPAEVQRVGDVMVVRAQAFGDERHVGEGELRRRDR